MKRAALRTLTPAVWIVLTLAAVYGYETYLRPAPPPAAIAQATATPTLTRAEQASATATAATTYLMAREACGAALRQQTREYFEQHPAEALARYDAEVGAFRSLLDRNHLEFQAVEAMPPDEQTAVLRRYADEVPYRIQLPELDAC